MTTARQGFIVNKLLEKGGVVNKVAANYVKAGFSVKVNPSIKNVDLIATRGGERYCIKVLWEKKTYGEKQLTGFIESCTKIGYNPVIILYGSGPRLDPGFLDKHKDIKVRRIRFKG